MLFDPGILLRAPLSILAVLGVIMVGKSLAAVAIVLAFRHPLGTALTIAASLAQIGEFSFIPVSPGLSLKLLPEEGRNLILGGALLSITLNPLFYALAARIEQIFAGRPDLAARFEREDVADVAVSGGAPPRRNHVVIVGFGWVGSSIGATLETWDMPDDGVERDRRRVLALGMSFYALRSLGVREGEARVFIDTARAESRSDAERAGR